MKTAEELKVLKEEVETLNRKLAELTEVELEQVAGGFIEPEIGGRDTFVRNRDIKGPIHENA